MGKVTGLNKNKKDSNNEKDKDMPVQAQTYQSLVNIKYKPLPKFKGCTNC